MRQRRCRTATLMALAIAGLAACTAGGGSSATPTTSTPAAPSTGASPVPSALPSVAATSAAPPSAAPTSASPVPSATVVASHLTASTLGWRLPTPLSRMVALAAPAGGIELAGGLLNGDHSSANVLHVDLSAGTVTADGTLATGVHDSAGAVVGSTLRVYAGGASVEVAGVQQLSPGGVATQVGTLPEPRSDLVVTVAAGKVVVLGGYTGSATLADVLVSSDGVHFTVLAKLPVPVRYPAVVTRGTDIYLYGGDVARVPTDVIQRISVTAGTAKVVGHLPRPTGHSAAFLLGGAVWLAGGTFPGGTSSRVYRSTDAVTFALAGQLPGPRSDMGVVQVDGVGYLIGGETPTRTSSVVALRPAP